jgi:predicted transcriptional regulator
MKTQPKQCKDTGESDTDFTEKNQIAAGMALKPIGEINRELPPVLHSAASAANTPGYNIDDIPEDVRKNMVGYENMETEWLLINILEAEGDRCPVDKIILALWLRYKKKIERTKVIQRLRSLVKDGYVTQESGKRGIYSLTEKGRTPREG